MYQSRVGVNQNEVAVSHNRVAVRQIRLAVIYSRVKAMLPGVAVPHAKDGVSYSEMEEPPEDGGVAQTSVGDSRTSGCSPS